MELPDVAAIEMKIAEHYNYPVEAVRLIIQASGEGCRVYITNIGGTIYTIEDRDDGTMVVVD